MVSQQGYISETTSTFQLGLCGPNEWVGEDILILNDLPFPFSIVAKTEVVALKISKYDLQNKIPSKFKNYLEQKSKDRNIWLQNRVKSITNTSNIIYKQDHKQTVYDTVMNQLCSQHPQATPNAVKSFTKHHISLSGTDNSGRIIKRVSTNHRKGNHPIALPKSKMLGLNFPLAHNDKTSNSVFINKAVFTEKPKERNFEYQNISNEQAYIGMRSNSLNSSLQNSSLKKKSIEMSLNNMKLNKDGTINLRSSVPTQIHSCKCPSHR